MSKFDEILNNSKPLGFVEVGKDHWVGVNDNLYLWLSYEIMKVGDMWMASYWNPSVGRCVINGVWPKSRGFHNLLMAQYACEDHRSRFEDSGHY